MISLLSLALSTALGGTVTFQEPQVVHGRPQPLAQPGPGACSLHFEVRDTNWGWIDYAPGADIIQDYEAQTLAAVVPDHDASLVGDSWCANLVISYVRLVGDWRVVDAEGAVLTRFVGPYAVDAKPLARQLGEMSAYRQGRRDPACQSSPEHECWTALELWLYLEDWKDAHCEPPTEGASGG